MVLNSCLVIKRYQIFSHLINRIGKIKPHQSFLGSSPSGIPEIYPSEVSKLEVDRIRIIIDTVFPNSTFSILFRQEKKNVLGKKDTSLGEHF